jgi:ABC-2 type transport system ATP-binding protein
MSNAVLECGDLRKAYGKKEVLRGVALALEPGTVVGLLGKNGAGKTTLIKCALGLIKSNSGDVRIFGEPAWSLSPQAKARLGYVPQTPVLYPWMKVRHMIDYTASFYPRWNQTLIDGLLTRWELAESARVGTLSVGQLQKLTILLALGHEPDLLVLDEPAAALDPVARREFLQALLDIAADERRTILFSTHITSDLERVADHVAILMDGQMGYFGSLDDLKDQVKRLHITASRMLPAQLGIADTLMQEVSGNQARVSLMNATPELIAQLERDLSATVTVENLNLDDIFLELHHV